MSVDTHFPSPPDMRMPKNPDGVDELGIRYEGPVLTGRVGVREAFRDEATKLSGHRESNLPDLGPGVQTGPVPSPGPPANRADALVSVDPVMQAQREKFGPPPSSTYTHPEQYDPVLRSHLRMEPAADPYEQRRREKAYWESIRHRHVR